MNEQHLDKIYKHHADVEKFLDETKGNFIDREMIKITEMKNSYYDAAIVNGMFSVCQNFDIHIDEAKLRKWVNMCISLEHISFKDHKGLAINAKIKRLEARVAELEAKNQNLKEHIEWQERILEMKEDFNMEKERNKLQDLFDFILSNVQLPLKFDKPLLFKSCVDIVDGALAKYGKYEKIIDLIETCKFDVDAVWNLIYINGAEIDLAAENNLEVINELFKEGKIKGYDRNKI